MCVGVCMGNANHLQVLFGNGKKGGLSFDYHVHKEFFLGTTFGLGLSHLDMANFRSSSGSNHVMVDGAG